MNNTALIVIGLGALFLMSGRGFGGGGGQTPDELRRMGYVYYDGRHGGRAGWYHISQFPNAGINTGGRSWTDYVQLALNTGQQILPSILQVFQNLRRPDRPDDVWLDAGGGNDGYGMAGAGKYLIA